MQIKYLLFDLDETLYPPDTGLWPVLGERMNTFIHTKLGIPMDQVEELREHYFHTFGTSLRGLQSDYEVDANEYLDYVHDVNIGDYIFPDKILQDLLPNLPGEKIIFTNANKQHSQRVLYALGISQYFSRIIDVVDMDPYCKPYPQAFKKAMSIIQDDDPSHYILLDDSIKNVQTALDLGMSAIHVSPQKTGNNGIVHIHSIHEIKEHLHLFASE